MRGKTDADVGDCSVDGADRQAQGRVALSPFGHSVKVKEKS
jgi:hypothetical protein